MEQQKISDAARNPLEKNELASIRLTSSKFWKFLSHENGKLAP